MDRANVAVTAAGARYWPINTIVVSVVCGGFVHVVFFIWHHMSQTLLDLKHGQFRELQVPLHWQILYTTSVSYNLKCLEVINLWNAKYHSRIGFIDLCHRVC